MNISIGPLLVGFGGIIVAIIATVAGMYYCCGLDYDPEENPSFDEEIHLQPVNCWNRTIRSGNRSRAPSRKTTEAPRTPEIRPLPSLPESMAEWEAEMSLIEKKDEELFPSTPLIEEDVQEVKVCIEMEDLPLPSISTLQMASNEFPGTLLPILALCLLPPITFVLIFFACTYCILIRRSPRTINAGGPPSPSTIRVQPASSSNTIPTMEMHMGYVIMCVMFGLMTISFLTFHIILPYSRLGLFTLRGRASAAGSVVPVSTTQVARANTDNFQRI
ncbi:hypothetical protein PRIPAC_81113 [Pristionchus pacificus]|uniref:Uncharacterized protein n=1 Tax=Pristionchus pacificus TaxID=54126 RepID=A0A2A6C2K2_PRIPA|nr:hypothetical protein PRIPAC_81113 [Pristionchus pacificus]|eukprot:PDM72339.1 hypothetical protein PRIPAC_38773 [Pristionchus pacificus]